MSASGQRSGAGGQESALGPLRFRGFGGGSRGVWLLALLAGLVLAVPGRADDSAAERRRRIESMEPAEKKQLLEKYNQFEALKPEKQEQLRQLYRQLQSDPDADQLRRVMHAYSEWLRSLPASTQAELLSLEPTKRIERIKMLRDQEEKDLNRRDLEGLLRWVGEFASDEKHQKEVLEAVPAEERQRLFDKSREEERAWTVGRIVWEQAFRPVPSEWTGWPGFWDRPDWLTDQEVRNLCRHLSERTRKRLANKTPMEQFNLINEWFHEWAARGFSGPWFRPPPEEIQQQLDRFFQGLPAQEQEELLDLGVDMPRELQRRYLSRVRLMPGRQHERERGPSGPPPDFEKGPPPDADRGPRPPERHEDRRSRKQ